VSSLVPRPRLVLILGGPSAEDIETPDNVVRLDDYRSTSAEIQPPEAA
jgi:hypothetical protein